MKDSNKQGIIEKCDNLMISVDESKLKYIDKKYFRISIVC